MAKEKITCRAISSEFFRIFSSGLANISLIDYLDNSYCDEISEIDLSKNTYSLVSHVAGKYITPETDGTAYALIEYAKKHAVHPDDIEIYDDLMNLDHILERLEKSSTPNFRFAHFRYLLTNGEYRWFEQAIITGRENGLGKGIIRVYIYDINNAKMRELGSNSNDKFLLDNEVDDFTGLLKEEFFIKKGQKFINSKNKNEWSSLIVDIEHFRLFDEWYGRETSSTLLSRIGKELAQFVEKHDGLGGYLGQDDFALLVPHDEKLYKEIYEIVRSKISEYDVSKGFAPAIGVCLLKDATSISDALDKSSIAAYHANQDFTNKIIRFDPNGHQNAENEYKILRDSVAAIKNKEITFYLQPQCRLSTGNVVGAEALTRWITPEGKVISPYTFIPILEKYNFISDLDLYIWDAVFAWLQKMLKSGIKPVPISVNISRIDIFSLDVRKILNDLAKKYQVPHSLIKVEITESAYSENSEIIDKLVKNLRHDGFMVLMDDFGSGYSSLNMLSTIEVDAIKIDGLFLKGNDARHSTSIRILESVINMGKQIGLAMIVEGVEDKEHADFLMNLGVRYIQGYYFYAPMPQSEFERILQDESKIDDRGFIAKSNEQFRLRELLDKNIYSDSMLNHILGAVAIYSLRENRVDIVRYNQQFYESVASGEFSSRLEAIENYMPEDDRPLLFATLKQAQKDKLNGSSGTFRFYLENGQITIFFIRFFYIGDNDGYPKFYGSAERITEYVRLIDEYHILANNIDKNIYFAEKNNDKWTFKVGCNGLKNYTQYEDKEMERVLNNIETSKYQEHIDTYRDLFSNFEKGKILNKTSVFHCKDGSTIDINIICKPIETYSRSANYLVIIEKIN